MAKDIDLSCNGIKFKLCINVIARPKAEAISIEIKSSLIGRHNIYNILAAIGAGLAIRMDLKDIKTGIEALRGLPGRLENIGCGQNFSVYVDYAHTEDGLEKALKSLAELKPNRIISVFGCGGSRDRSKRPVMGKISTEFSDLVFITSDNPRDEEPMDIINEIVKGISPEKNNYLVEPDRCNAIKKALAEAGPGDIVLVAGKGHESYQILKDTTIPFDDREVVKRILKEAGLCLQSETY
jgi:UDP-N-acetylmuramoyl-L-alanyl-D-glutamate--2,6-diaminopimelate ligase